MCNQAQVLLNRSCTLGKLVNTQTKGITLLCIGKNNTYVSCVFNGFKYSSFQKGMTFCRSIYVKKVMKLLAFIFELF